MLTAFRNLAREVDEHMWDLYRKYHQTPMNTNLPVPTTPPPLDLAPAQLWQDPISGNWAGEADELRIDELNAPQAIRIGGEHGRTYELESKSHTRLVYKLSKPRQEWGAQLTIHLT